jgi:hypothetical protein
MHKKTAGPITKIDLSNNLLTSMPRRKIGRVKMNQKNKGSRRWKEFIAAQV